MSNKQTIRKIIALPLVLLLLFSSTPKKYWHDLLVDHVDSYSISLEKKAAFSQQRFNCHADDLVVKSPFIEVASQNKAVIPVIYTEKPAACSLDVILNKIEAKDSRGPPAII